MEIDREPHSGDEADRASYFIESVIDDHVKEAMRRAADELALVFQKQGAEADSD